MSFKVRGATTYLVTSDERTGGAAVDDNRGASEPVGGDRLVSDGEVRDRPDGSVRPRR